MTFRRHFICHSKQFKVFKKLLIILKILILGTVKDVSKYRRAVQNVGCYIFLSSRNKYLEKVQPLSATFWNFSDFGLLDIAVIT